MRLFVFSISIPISILSALCFARPATCSEPCAFSPLSVPDLVLPLDGDTAAPRNATPVVFLFDDATIAVGGNEASYDVETFVIDDPNFDDAAFHRLVPREPFAVDSEVSVSHDDRQLGTFTVADAEDTTPPSPPALTFIGAATGGACDPLVEIRAETDEANVFFLARRDEAPGLDSSAHAISTTEQVIVGGEASSHATVQVIAVDRAGNASGVSSVDVDFPEEEERGLRPAFGCGSTRSDASAFALLAFALGLRSRRRPHER